MQLTQALLVLDHPGPHTYSQLTTMQKPSATCLCNLARSQSPVLWAAIPFIPSLKSYSLLTVPPAILSPGPWAPKVFHPSTALLRQSAPAAAGFPGISADLARTAFWKPRLQFGSIAAPSPDAEHPTHPASMRLMRPTSGGHLSRAESPYKNARSDLPQAG